MSTSETGSGPLARLGEPVAVLGVGVEGRATLGFLLGKGVGVTALDAREIDDLPPGVEAVRGEGYDRDLERFATVFRSPGVRPDTPAIERARRQGTRITSATDFFLKECPAPVVGVTGTLGKGTSCSLAAAMLEACGFAVHLGGNIGRNPLEFLDDVRPEHRVVIEVSSFQAMDLSASPRAAVALRTTSEHLDWHRDTEEYVRAKARLVSAQTPRDTVVYHADSPASAGIALASPGTRLGYSLERELDAGFFPSGERWVVRLGATEETAPLALERMRLPGRFNLENVGAALLAAISVGADLERSCEVAESFEGLPHRLELAAEGGGVRFYNDSYATRPEATAAALSSFDGPVALILGGSEKRADFGPIARAATAHPGLVRACLIGATADRLEREIRAAGRPAFELTRHADLAGAAEAALSAVSGSDGTVLFSPGCASFDMFPNYKVRGERFRAIAQELAEITNRKAKDYPGKSG